MRRENTSIMQCCICGREKTEQGWQYPCRPEDAAIPRVRSFCMECYENEMMKLRLQAAMLALPAAG